MKYLAKILIAGCLLGATGAAAQTADGPSLRIYSGVRDTLTTAKTTVVGVTVPGAQVTVNGVAVKVYKTGSFGTTVDLKPGDNALNITSTLNGTTSVIDRNIFFNDHAPKAVAKPEGQTTYYADARYVETLPGAYLQYGNGDDRLGGSKMGFLDPGITLKAVGEKGSLLCVRLAADRVAYIPKSYTKPGSSNTPVVNTGSWSVTNTGKTDRVVVSLPRRLPYSYSTSLQPAQITVDLFGATDNSNWITQRSAELGIIDFVDFEQVAEDVYRVTLRLEDKNIWGYSVHYDEGNNLVIEVRHRPASLELKNLTIGLDAGHGGENPGAISPSGIKEKDVNLDIVLKVRDLLVKKGAKVVLTRDGDTGPSMAERKKIWLDGNVDIAISVHNNSGGSPLSSPGTAVLYKHLYDRPFAQAVLNRLLQTGLPLFGLVGNFNFSLNAPTEYPNVLIEGMFMSSLAEEELLADETFRARFAQKIVDGLVDYLNAAK